MSLPTICSGVKENWTAGEEDLHAELHRVDAQLLAELGGGGTVNIGGGGTLEHEGIGHHGREQKLGLRIGELLAQHLEELGHDGAAGAPRHGHDGQRRGSGEVAEAVMVHDAHDLGVRQTGNTLSGLVVVGEDDLLRVLALGRGLDGIESSIGSDRPASARSFADSAGSGPSARASYVHPLNSTWFSS